MSFSLKKIDYNLLAIGASILFILIFILKIHPESILVSDNQRKMIQAQAFIDSNFQSEYSSCPVLKDLGQCAYFHRGKGDSPTRIVGVFPVAFSLVASVFGLLGNYSFLYYMSLILFLISISIMKFRSDVSWIGILALTIGPCFFHSMAFPDYAITFFLTTTLVSFYDRPAASFLGNGLIGFLCGLVIFFRPENIFLPFFLGAFQLIDFFLNRNSNKKEEFDKSRLVILICTGLAVITFLIVNYSLYDSVLGTRIAGNSQKLLTQERNKTLSLLLFANGRIGFLLFSPWIILAFFLFVLKFRTMEKKFKFLLMASFFSLVAIVLFAPNDANLDWGTRYLSWISVPIVLLTFSENSKKLLLEFGRKIKISAVTLLCLSIAVSLIYMTVQIQYSKAFIKYNTWLKNQKTEITVVQQPNIEILYGQDILHRKVLFPDRREDPKKFVQFITPKVSIIDLVRYEPSTAALLESYGAPPEEEDYVPGSDYRLEKEFKQHGWKEVSKQRLEKIEIVTLER